MLSRRFLFQTHVGLRAAFRPCTASSIRPHVAQYSQQSSPKSDKDNVNFEEPVQFSSSKASNFNTAENELRRGRTNRAKYEAEIVKFSLFCFLVYFLVLREESDWDRDIGASIFDKVPELELVMLRNKMKMASNPGADPFTESDRLRLAELEKEMKQ